MSVFDLDERGQLAVEEEARTRPIADEHLDAGFWEGTASGLGQGLMGGAAKLGRMTAFAVGAPLARADDLAGTPGKMSDPYFRWVDENIGSAVDFWTPRAEEVGTAGRVLGGLAEIVAPLMLGGGNPTPLIASAGTNTAIDLTGQGVDSTTALEVGAIQSAATYAGFKIPFFGKTLGSRMASGVVGNVAVNVPAAYASQQLLAAQGYDAAAAQFDPWNVEARVVDLLTGLAFGAVAHVSRPSDRAAVAAAANAKHFQHDTAPGRPVTMADSVAHQAALDSAIEQLAVGDRVTVPPEVVNADFTGPPRPPRFDTDTATRTMDEAGVPYTPPKAAPEPIETPRVTAPEAAGDAQASPLPDAAATPGSPDGASARGDTPGKTPDPPEVAAARAAIAETDFELPTGEIDADGNPVVRSAREVLAEADAEVKSAEEQGTAYEAAVACFLHRGVA